MSNETKIALPIIYLYHPDCFHRPKIKENTTVGSTNNKKLVSIIEKRTFDLNRKC